MKTKYAVHSVATQKVAVNAMLNGEPVVADVDCLVVELISEDGSTSHTHRFSSQKDMEEAKELFVYGASIDCTFTASAEEPAVE